MVDSSVALMSAGIVIPLAGSLAVRFLPHARAIAVAAVFISLICTAAGVWPWLAPNHDPALDRALIFGAGSEFSLGVDELSAVPMLLFCCLSLGVLTAAPLRDTGPQGCSTVLFLLASTLTACAAATPAALVAGWAAGTLPFLFRSRAAEEHTSTSRYLLPKVAMISSLALLAVGLLIWKWLPAASLWGFIALLAAALIRNGVFPFHTWVIAAFSEGPLLAVGLFMNAHLGALLVARVIFPSFPRIAQSAMPVVADIALVSAVYCAFTGLGERNPRRLLALLMTSQAAFIFAGLESTTPEGVTGALTHWVVVAVAMTGLLVIYRALEVRCGSVVDSRFAGLTATAPRFAVFFAVCGLALVGLPGTLGFCAEDLLFQGALESHPRLGIALPLATALNAINVFGLFCRMFLGRRSTAVPGFPDALPRERAALSVLILFLFVTGIAPRTIISIRTASAHAIAEILAAAPLLPR